jgi:hypothetical protein
VNALWEDAHLLLRLEGEIGYARRWVRLTWQQRKQKPWAKLPAGVIEWPLNSSFFLPLRQAIRDVAHAPGRWTNMA